MANKTEKNDKSADKADKADKKSAKKPAGKDAKADAKPKAPAKKPAAKKPAAKKPEPAKKPAGKKKPPVEDAATAEALAPPATGPEDAPVEAAGDAELEASATDAGPPADEVIEAEIVEEAAPALSPEEQELAAIYGDELAAAPAAAAHAEFADRQTADEDRPMTPEINRLQERKKRWEERRDQRRARHDFQRARRQERSRDGRPEGGRPDAGRPEGGRPDAGRPEGGRPEGERRPDRGLEPRRDERRDERRPDRPRDERQAQLPLPAAAPSSPALPLPLPAPVALPADATGVVRVGNALGDAAWQVFAGLRGAQPMPVRQLAGMMRKRGLFDQDPEQAWPHLKAALLGDERSYRALGLRPRIVYRGRDLFGPGPVATSATAEAEAELARALSAMAVATHATLKARIGQAGQAGFERLVHAYLIAVGYQEINWIKRTESISYATAIAPGASGTILVSARSGDEPVDRRGVGELRVGVEAKQLLAGHLFAARELSPEAERELERPGRSIAVYAGDSFVTALLSAGVGVVTSAAPVRYVDDQLFGELLAG